MNKDYDCIAKVISFLSEHYQEQPGLEQMAKVSGLSVFHFQRTFARWAGVSPKKFVQFLTKEHAKEVLKKSNVLEASFESGLSGPSRLHDLFITCEAMSPGEYKQKGKGLDIKYGFHPSPLGECFIAVTQRGICYLSFVNPLKDKEILKDFHKRWSNAVIKEDQSSTKSYVHKIFAPSAKGTIKLLCGGTNFQIKVWEALLKIPEGQLVSYKTVASLAGYPKAVRAVGTAIGQNPIPYLIPCHRVIRETGHLGGYSCGLDRKRAILAKEAIEGFSDLG